MADWNLGVKSLYAWTVRTQQELDQQVHDFPPTMMTDYSRLAMSLNCLRVGLEMRIQDQSTPVRPPAHKPAGRSLDSPDLPC
jgi:hypothetical protein